MPEPSTTTYALLSLLALQSWTGYELVQQAKRSLRYAWPRSEANLYQEQKRLVTLGWATVEKELTGKRSRNRYTITKSGRAALKAWLATRPSEPHIEIEGILRMFFADLGTVEHLIESLKTTAADARDALTNMADFADDYLETGGPFPDRLHLIALAADMVTDVMARIDQLSEHAAKTVATWDTTKDLGLTPETRKVIERIASRRPKDPR